MGGGARTLVAMPGISRIGFPSPLTSRTVESFIFAAPSAVRFTASPAPEPIAAGWGLWVSVGGPGRQEEEEEEARRLLL